MICCSSAEAMQPGRPRPRALKTQWDRAPFDGLFGNNQIVEQ